MPDVATAFWIAIGCGVAALVVLVVVAVGTWRQWTRTRDTRSAASALIDTHRARLDVTMDQVADQAGRVGAHSQELQDAVAQLRADVDHLQWLAAKVPDAREELRTALLDLVLPTALRRTEESS